MDHIAAVVVGSINLDLVAELPRIPAVGETRRASVLRRSAGGKGANQAVALARLGASVSMVGRVGDDADGRFLVSRLTEAGVSVAHVGVDPGAPTGLAFVMLDAEGDNAIVVAPGANAALAAVPDLAGCDLVVAQLETSLAAVEGALRWGASAGALVVLNAAPASPVPDSLLAVVDVLVVNEHEAREISGESDVSAAAVALMSRGAATVVVTLGASGAVLLNAGGRYAVDGFPVRAVDTVGAGDCFVAAVAVALASKRPPVEAVRFANAAAAIAVTRPGAQDAMPTRAEVEAFLR